MFDPGQIIVTSLPSVAFNDRRDLPSCQGLYFVVADATVVYIGKAKNIQQRWIGHHRKADVAHHGASSISWLEFDGAPELLTEIERACIEYFDPALNGRSVEHAAAVRFQLVIPKTALEDVKHLADGENRSISNMLSTLVIEAIQSRKEKTEPA